MHSIYSTIQGITTEKLSEFTIIIYILNFNELTEENG